MPAPFTPDVAARLGARALRASEAGFPAGLLDLSDAPAVVYVEGGELPLVAGAVAIVGSRAASRYGAAQAHRLAGQLARLGIVVVSGLARGIDAAAHRGALDAGGRTVAVLPGGLDSVTPQHHRQLAREIVVRGALLTEWESGPPRAKGVFVRRNRLIAALAGATVVVEAAERSGALSTATAARRLGRPVLAVPGDVDRDTAKGCHDLIRSGAQLCTCAADVLQALGATGAGGPAVPTRRGAPFAALGRDGAEPGSDPSAPSLRSRPTPRGTPGPPALDPPGLSATPEARLLAALSSEPTTVDALACATCLSVPETLATLLTLRLAGVAMPVAGQRWVRAR